MPLLVIIYDSYHSTLSTLVPHILRQNLLGALLADHRYHVNEYLNGVSEFLVLLVDGREDALVEGRFEDQLRQLADEVVDDVPQELGHCHHVYLVDAQSLLQALGRHVDVQQLVADADEQLVEELPGSLGQQLGVGPEGVVGKEGALLRVHRKAVGKQQHTLV